jgi:hypothetical protein
VLPRRFPRDADSLIRMARITNPRLGETSAQGPRQVDDHIGRSAAADSAICHFVDEARDRALVRPHADHLFSLKIEPSCADALMSLIEQLGLN